MLRIAEISHVTLDKQNAGVFSELALKCVGQEFPNKPGHVMKNKQDVLCPEQMHPAFFGCFDWHSAVHGHWLLVKVLKLYPDISNKDAIRKVLNTHLTKENLLAETHYFGMDHHTSFERTYGWAWFLKLAEELEGWDDPDRRRWRESLRPLEAIIVKRYMDFFPKQTYPIRKGDHPNTAFGISFALDYARKMKQYDFEMLLSQRALDYFGNDIECPGNYEPDGDDFFSPCLIEADMMTRLLDEEAFIMWFDRFLPEMRQSSPQVLLNPATVTDRNDGKLVHLDGLNITRAWCMLRIAEKLGEKHPAYSVLKDSAERHRRSALAHVMSGEYAGEHWQASFAVYLLSQNH